MVQHLFKRTFKFTHDPPTNIVDFRGFDSSTILIVRGGILVSIGDFPESLSQAVLVGTMLVGGLDVMILIMITDNIIMITDNDNDNNITYNDN